MASPWPALGQFLASPRPAPSSSPGTSCSALGRAGSALVRLATRPISLRPRDGRAGLPPSAASPARAEGESESDLKPRQRLPDNPPEIGRRRRRQCAGQGRGALAARRKTCQVLPLLGDAFQDQCQTPLTPHTRTTVCSGRHTIYGQNGAHRVCRHDEQAIRFQTKMYADVDVVEELQPELWFNILIHMEYWVKDRTARDNAGGTVHTHG